MHSVNDEHDPRFKVRQTKLIHRKINRLGYVTRISLILQIAALAALVVQAYASLSWWAIGTFFLALLAAFSLTGHFYLREND